VNLTQTPYSYAGDDPMNQSDPLGLWPSWGDLNPVSAAQRAWNDTGGKAVSYVHQHQTGFEVGAGVVLGVAAATTGVGAVVEAAGVASAVAAGATVAEASTGALAYGATAAVTGGLAAALDNGQCEAGNTAACIGRDLGAVGALTGSVATLGSGGLALGLWQLESLPDAIFQGLGAFSAIFGIASSIFDTTSTAAGAETFCGQEGTNIGGG
jgi:hypothetical protein